ncbi:hypothetical protein [Rhizobium phaseoli]
MTGFAIVQERAFAAALEEMTDDELFNLMRDLEMRGEALDRPSPADEIFAKLVLTESAIERRFPGQMLRPYKDWLRRPERSKRRADARQPAGHASAGGLHQAESLFERDDYRDAPAAA